MYLWLVLLGLCGLSVAVPQNWPYRDSLMPYRYGYPSQSQYKYLPQVEDDEETGPYLSGLHGRQDLVVGSEGDGVRPTAEPGVSVIETGSVAPVVEPSRNPRPSQSSPTHKPVGVDTGRPVQPPPFPAARPPPPPPKGEEEEEDDESEEDAADDDAEVEDEEEADDGEGEGDADEEEGNNTEDDEEEERRRLEPLVILKEDKIPEAIPAIQVAPIAPTIITTTIKPVISTKKPNVNLTAVANSTNATQPAISSKPTEGEDQDGSSEEQGLPGIEALVPGYVTDQGEVLVPVDTVTGDQPISIVPDPYGQPTRGVPISRGPTYRGPYGQTDDYDAPPYYFSDVYGGLRRQEDSDELDLDVDDDIPPTKNKNKVSAQKKNVVQGVDEAETDDEETASGGEGSTKEPDSVEAELEGRNEYLTAFPPSRTPELFAVIKSRIPVDSSSEYDDYFQSHEYNGPYSYEPKPQHYSMYRPKIQQQSPSVSLAVSLSGNQQGYSSIPYNRRFAAQQQSYKGYPYSGMQQGYDDPYEMYRPIPSQFYRRPVPIQRPNQFLDYQPNQFSGYQQPSPIYRPNQFSGYQQQPSPIYRPNQFSGYQPPSQFGGYDRPMYRPLGYGQGPSVFIARPPNVPLRRPGQGNKQAVAYLRPTGVKITQLRKPTPVIKQKKQPAESFEIPTYGDSSVDNSSGTPESYEIPNIQKDHGKMSVVKTRRAAKMTKKPSKKLLESKKATSSDPLNILKKINSHAKRH